MAQPQRSILPYQVAYADTDMMGVVYYANYFSLFERGRTELFRDMGIPYSEIEKQGIYVPVSDARCRYKRSARYDDLVSIMSSVQETKPARITIAYQIYRNGNELRPRAAAWANDIHRPTSSSRGKNMRQ